jgi:hypothetical protein
MVRIASVEVKRIGLDLVPVAVGERHTMTNTAAWTHFRSQPLQTVGEQVSLGSYTTYGEAQAVVDFLADQRFEVETTQIIGSDLRMVEQVTGRLTWPRALVAGVASGAWFGVFVGLLLGILVTTSFLPALIWGLSWGVVFGAVFAAAGYGLTRGRRDFTSLRVTVPSRFEVLVANAHSEHARTLLAGSTR